MMEQFTVYQTEGETSSRMVPPIPVDTNQRVPWPREPILKICIILGSVQLGYFSMLSLLRAILGWGQGSAYLHLLSVLICVVILYLLLRGIKNGRSVLFIYHLCWSAISLLVSILNFYYIIELLIDKIQPEIAIMFCVFYAVYQPINLAAFVVSFKCYQHSEAEKRQKAAERTLSAVHGEVSKHISPRNLHTSQGFLDTSPRFGDSISRTNLNNTLTIPPSTPKEESRL